MRSLLMWIVLLVCAGCVAAQDNPAPKPLGEGSSVDEVLDALDARGKSISDFVAQVTFREEDNSTASSTVHTGNVKFARLPDGNARMLVDFQDRSINDKKPVKERSLYLLDPPWLVERDFRAKKEIRRKVLKEGQKLNLLKLGEGPFPLPLGQDKQDVHAQFEAKKVAAAKDDPAGTVHIQLIPKQGKQFDRKYAAIDVWVDPKSNMPVRVAVLDKNKVKTRTTDLSDVKVNTGLKDKDFALEAVPNGWDRVDEPYEE